MTVGNGTEDRYHIPAMLEETLAFLQPAPGKVIVDATLGGGGHAESILKKLHPGGKLIGIDWDDDALEAAKKKLSTFGEAFIPVKSNFAYLGEVAAELGVETVDGVLFDLGVSSFQVDCVERGFSYRENVFLDMRMDRSIPRTAALMLQELSRQQLASIFKEYGEEKWAGRIASFIIRHRESKGHIVSSRQLVDIIKAAVPAKARRRGGHPAKRVFQALRIAVNRELENLSAGLNQGVEILKPGGRIVVISYHSLEDRMTKRIFRKHSRQCSCPPELPVCRCGGAATVKVLTGKPLMPTPDEVARNSRAKSARLRAAEKLLSRH